MVWKQIKQSLNGVKYYTKPMVIQMTRKGLKREHIVELV